MSKNKELDELLKEMNESQQALYRKLMAARTTASGQKAGAGRRSSSLDADELVKIKMEVARFKASQKDIANQIGVVWSAQLDQATVTGDVEALRRAILEQHAIYDNCSCQNCPQSV